MIKVFWVFPSGTWDMLGWRHKHFSTFFRARACQKIAIIFASRCVRLCVCVCLCGWACESMCMSASICIWMCTCVCSKSGSNLESVEISPWHFLTILVDLEWKIALELLLEFSDLNSEAVVCYVSCDADVDLISLTCLCNENNSLSWDLNTIYKKCSV